MALFMNSWFLHRYLLYTLGGEACGRSLIPRVDISFIIFQEGVRLYYLVASNPSVYLLIIHSRHVIRLGHFS